MTKKHHSFRLSDETAEQIDYLAKRLRWTKTQVVEAGVQEFRKRVAAAAALEDMEPGSIVLVLDEAP
jgi:predicted DNA-binding protein